MKILKFSVNLCLLYLIIIQSGFCQELYDMLTDEEKSQMFLLSNTADESIPNYQIVRVWYDNSSQSESSDNGLVLNVRNVNENRTVNLKPVDQSVVGTMTPIWLATWKKDQMTFKQLPAFTMGFEVQMYETDENTIIGSGVHSNGVKYFVGYIGGSVITPLIESVAEKVGRSKRSIELNLAPGIEDPSGNFILSGYHILYKSSKSLADELKASAEAAKKIQEISEAENNKHKSKRQAYLPVDDVTIYPEIILYTDYGPQFIEPRGLLFNRFIIYIIAFWNSVNLYYKSLENPRVSLRVTGIIIGTAPFDVPFLEKNTNRYNQVQQQKALLNMGQFFADHEHIFPRSLYDIAITMTERKLCSQDNRRNTCTGNTLGIARLRALCVDSWGMPMSMTGIAHDDLNFGGIVTAAHELAHIIGVAHDGDRALSPYCDSSDRADNYIMNAYSMKTKLPFVWSNCSRLSFRKYLADNVRRCLRKENMNHGNGPLTVSILPGQMLPIQAQCETRRYSYACDKQHNICKSLQCWTSGFYGFFFGYGCDHSGPAMDGTSCGPNKYCSDGECVDSPTKSSSLMSYLLSYP